MITPRHLILPVILALAGATSLSAIADNPSSIGQLPGEKIPEELQPRERNPFTRRDAKPTAIAADRQTEESQLRAIFHALSVTGVVRGGPADKVLLGSLILEAGEAVPPLLEGQNERLVVAAITGKQVEIQFMETESRDEPRRIFVPIDLHPHVAVQLPTLPKIPDAPAGEAIQPPE